MINIKYFLKKEEKRTWKEMQRSLGKWKKRKHWVNKQAMKEEEQW
jgi:hypothetical protein